MTTRTLCLSVLVLLCAAFPAQAFRLTLAGVVGGTGTPGWAPRRLDRAVTGQLVFAVALIATAALAATLAPMRWELSSPVDWRWYAAAVVFGAIAPVLEWAAGAGLVAIRHRRLARIALHRLAGGRSAWVVLASVGAAAAEEVLFRGVALHLLDDVLGWPAAAALAVTAVVYGLNHLYFGAMTVAQKTLTGVGFGLLYLLAGHNVLVPLVAHAVQNIVVLTVLPRREGA
ncbi:CPBP family intramembrane glutamic endopeptidase [Dactylosporangium sp. NPDC005572]|uniref:CPBP family intramembrane glutamic endopeptidase n=1 Tax=Dactylosporangium sp. NPDC005572 TaxID=3156889 RepID=UPI0033B5B762